MYIINLHLSLRFSSGDLSAECDEVDPQAIPVGTKPPPLQQQPLPQGGPPNMPPPPGKYLFLIKDIYIFSMNRKEKPFKFSFVSFIVKRRKLNFELRGLKKNI